MRISLAITVAISLLGWTSAALSDTYVRGYTRNDGVYVQPHHRTNPDSNRFNNYGTQGNVNPYTGQAGTVDPYKPTNPYGANSLGSGNSLYGTNRRGW